MAHFGDDWGIYLCAEPSANLNWSATGDVFFSMSEYFEPPEREEYLITRSELEEYIRFEQALVPRQVNDNDNEWIDLIEFLQSTKQENFRLCAWW
jgi:hypothetical protein